MPGKTLADIFPKPLGAYTETDEDWTEERRSVWLTSALGRALVIFAECPIRADRQLVFLRLETLLQASGTIPDTRSFSSLQRAHAGKPQPANERPEKRQRKKKKA